MTEETVNTLLEGYRSNLARYECLAMTAETHRRQLEAEERNALANDAMHAQQYDGMPHGNKISRPVEDLVLRHTSGQVSEQIKLWRAEEAEMRAEMMELKRRIRYVDAWLNGLSDKERLVMEEVYIKGYTMPEVAYHSHKLFLNPVTVGTVRGIKRQALKKIYDIAR